MKMRGVCVAGISVLMTASGFAGEPAPSSTGEATWSPQAAAAYMDGRMTWWSTWTNAARDQGTFCVSCHTVVPYAMSRLTLRAALGEKAPTTIESKLVENVTKRVRMWDQVEPYYSDQNRGAGKSAESRGTEAILNALVLATYSAPSGVLSADARLALDNMWAAQLKSGEAKGAWNWLQFHNAPWEGDSQFYGATLAALAVAATPASYRSAAEVREGLDSLREYLARNSAGQKLIDRMMWLWASTKMQGFVSAAEKKSIIAEALSKQQADGGFSTTDFVGDWKRGDKTPLPTQSDGYATSVVALVLQDAGVARDQAQLQRALTWLSSNQQKSDGRWIAYSLNKNRDLSSDAGRFMSDAATAFAASALTRAQR